MTVRCLTDLPIFRNPTLSQTIVLPTYFQTSPQSNNGSSIHEVIMAIAVWFLSFRVLYIGLFLQLR